MSLKVGYDVESIATMPNSNGVRCQCCNTGFVSQPYILRKVDKNVVDLEASDPISQLQKVCQTGERLKF